MLTDKDKLRKSIRHARQAFVRNHYNQNDINHFAHPELARVVRGARCVGGYMPVGSEADVRPLLRMMADENVPLALPYLEGRDAVLEFRYWIKDAPLINSSYGFFQPEPTSEPAMPDVILVPLIGFDRAMNRLGQGAGHYDRLLAALPASLRIGMAWSIQETDAIPTDTWDMPMDAVQTEKEWIMGANSRIND